MLSFPSFEVVDFLVYRFCVWWLNSILSQENSKWLQRKSCLPSSETKCSKSPMFVLKRQIGNSMRTQIVTFDWWLWEIADSVRHNGSWVPQRYDRVFWLGGSSLTLYSPLKGDGLTGRDQFFFWDDGRIQPQCSLPWLWLWLYDNCNVSTAIDGGSLDKANARQYCSDTLELVKACLGWMEPGPCPQTLAPAIRF